MATVVLLTCPVTADVVGGEDNGCSSGCSGGNGGGGGMKCKSWGEGGGIGLAVQGPANACSVAAGCFAGLSTFGALLGSLCGPDPPPPP